MHVPPVDIVTGVRGRVVVRSTVWELTLDDDLRIVTEGAHARGHRHHANCMQCGAITAKGGRP